MEDDALDCSRRDCSVTVDFSYYPNQHGFFDDDENVGCNDDQYNEQPNSVFGHSLSTKEGLSSLGLTASHFMTDQFLFDCFVQCTPKRPFEMEEECIDNWNRKQPPIVDILVIEEKDIDVRSFRRDKEQLLPSDYLVVMNQDNPSGLIPINTKSRGFLCVKRLGCNDDVIVRAFGRGSVHSLRFFTKSQLKNEDTSGFSLISLYPDCTAVSFTDSRSSEPLYLGQDRFLNFHAV